MFSLYLKRKDKEIFATSLYEIDRKINKRQKPKSEQREETKEEILRCTVPKEYYDLLDVFSKSESDKLVPYRKYDYKIELTANNNLGYLPLRKHTEEELRAIKKYITKNLDKGFISISVALFTALILFTQKGDKTLRFYVNYYKLNLITKKD